MRLINTTGILLLLLSLVSSSVMAQDSYTKVTRDLETWASAGLKLKFNNKFAITLDQGLRLRENSTTTDQVLTDFGLKWSPIKQLQFGFGSRYILDRGSNGINDNDFRWNLDAAFKHEVKRFEFKYRLRYQNKNELGISKAEGDESKNYLRFKAGVDYNIKGIKLKPFISTEIFRHLSSTDGSFDNWRYTIGADYDLKKFGEVGVFYRMERELNDPYPKTTNIVGLSYVFTLKFKKDEKK